MKSGNAVTVVIQSAFGPGHMLSKKTSEELWAIARAGGGLEIDASQYNTEQLRGIAHAVADGKAPFLRLFNSGSKSAVELRTIAEAGSGKVMFA